MQSNALVTTLESNLTAGLSEELTNDIRSFAKKSGWPDNVASKLTVEYADDTLVISYPDSLESKISELEYGTAGTPPRAVFRPFEVRMRDVITKASSQIALELFMEGEL